MLRQIYPLEFPVEHVVNDIRETIECEKHAGGWDAILNPTPAIKRMLIVGIGTAGRCNHFPAFY